MRGFSLLMALMFCSATLPVADATEGGPELFFRDDFESGAEGWWGDPGWGLTDNRANSGDRSMFFGDDKGTPEPSDNDVLFCDRTYCQHELRSPVFHLPEGSPAHLYFWTQLDLLPPWLGETLEVDVEVMAEGDQVFERAAVVGTDRGHGWTFHGDLSPYAGASVRLVFTASQGILHEFYEGLYLDDVVVTDLFVETEVVQELNGVGPAARFSFDADPASPMIIQSTVRGNISFDGIGYLLSKQRDDGPRWISGMTGGGGKGFAFGSNVTHHQFVYHLPAGGTVTVLSLRVLDHDATLTTFSDGRASLTLSLDAHRLASGTWDYALAAFGFENATSTTTVRSQGTSHAGASAGGEVVVFETPRQLDAAVLVAERHEGAFTIVDGHGAWETNGPSLGWIFLIGLGDVRVANPEGVDDHQSPHHSEESGTWSIHVRHASGTYGATMPSFMVSTLPSVPILETNTGPDLFAIPFGTRAGEVHLPVTGERAWSFSGSLGCQARILGAGTDTSCGLFPVVWSTDRFPILSSGGLRSVDYRLDAGMEWVGPAPGTQIGETCVSFAGGDGSARGCMDDGRFHTLVQGDPIIDGTARLEFHVGKENGVALLERVYLDLVLHYDLT